MSDLLKKTLYAGAGALALVTLGYGALFGDIEPYSLGEGQQAVVISQGKVERVYVGSFDVGKEDEARIAEVRQWAQENGYEDVIIESAPSGLKWKNPIFDRVYDVPDQIQTFISVPEGVHTDDERRLMLGFYVSWYVDNPLEFHLRAQSVARANNIIDTNLYQIIRDVVSDYKYDDVVRTSDRSMGVLEVDFEEGSEDLVHVKAPRLEGGRNEILEEIITRTREQVAEYGITIIDAGFLEVELTPENTLAVFDQMISERQQIAEQYRVDARAEAATIVADAERNAADTRATARETAGTIVGEGEEEAARIYSEASLEAPEFFRLWHTLREIVKAFENGEGSQRLVLSTESDFMKYLMGINK